MKLKNLILFMIIIANTIAFSQSASTNTIKTNSLLMAKTIKAYQIKSENKIEEFYNLLNIIGNPDVKTILKEQTIIEIYKFFKDKNAKIPNLIDDKNKEISFSDFLNLLSKSKERIIFETESKGQSYVQESNGNKFWTIGYDLNISQGKTKTKLKNVMQNVSLLQEEKQFGSTKKTVQNVYLTLIWLK
jgi:hypothetical protein